MFGNRKIEEKKTIMPEEPISVIKQQIEKPIEPPQYIEVRLKPHQAYYIQQIFLQPKIDSQLADMQHAISSRMFSSSHELKQFVDNYDDSEAIVQWRGQELSINHINALFLAALEGKIEQLRKLCPEEEHIENELGLN